ncbi:MAG: hypothetical protein WAV16_00590 [Candidatus Moraniibacteriota bacterium]
MEKTIVENIFGKTEFKKNELKLGIDPEKILAPFEERDSVTRIFCENCEGYYEIPQNVVDELLTASSGENNLKKGEYLCTDGCAVCNKERTVVTVKKIEIH